MDTKLGKYSITFSNEEEYHLIKNDVFTNNSYYFQTEKDDPYIVDVGAHIGISILYFKKHYPNCKITAFEPNPTNFQMLEENIFQNCITNVELINSAIWVEEGEKDLHIDSSELDRFSVSSFTPKAWNSSVDTNRIRVNTERLAKYLNQNIDLLKIDVEGAEQKILKDIKNSLQNVKNIIIEFHPTGDQDIKKVLEMLNTSGFDTEIFLDGKLQKKLVRDRLVIIRAIRN
jgi:FkbM family methyltransferase